MLVPLDGSKLAEEVFFYAKDLAVSLDLDLILLNVHEASDRSARNVHQAYIEAMINFVKHHSIEVDKGTKGEPGHKALNISGEVVAGYPVEEIIRYASENRIDFILIASHEDTKLGRWMRGSVADKVLEVSQVPVWLIKAADLEEYVYIT
jgi:nucleotide-binding universal stress UspA family protein